MLSIVFIWSLRVSPTSHSVSARRKISEGEQPIPTKTLAIYRRWLAFLIPSRRHHSPVPPLIRDLRTLNISKGLDDLSKPEKKVQAQGMRILNISIGFSDLPNLGKKVQAQECTDRTSDLSVGVFLLSSNGHDTAEPQQEGKYAATNAEGVEGEEEVA